VATATTVTTIQLVVTTIAAQQVARQLAIILARIMLNVILLATIEIMLVFFTINHPHPLHHDPKDNLMPIPHSYP